MVESKAATAEPGWQLEDVDNEGAVLLIEYDLAAFRLVHDRHPDRPAQPSPLPNGEGHHANEIGVQAESVRWVRRGVTKVVRSFLSADVSADTALMDAGLDSQMMQTFVQVSVFERGVAWSACCPSVADVLVNPGPPVAPLFASAPTRQRHATCNQDVSGVGGSHGSAAAAPS